MEQKTNDETNNQTDTATRNGARLRIYVASLADYNAGLLLGRWIEVTADADDIRRQIAEILAESTEAFAEEWAIHDHEGFGPLRLSEGHDLDNLAAIAAGVEAHGELFLHVLEHLGGTTDVDEAVRCLSEQYCGAYESLAAWAEASLRDCHAQEIDALPPLLQWAIDWELVARECELGGDVFSVEVDGHTHVFWN